MNEISFCIYFIYFCNYKNIRQSLDNVTLCLYKVFFLTAKVLFIIYFYSHACEERQVSSAYSQFMADKDDKYSQDLNIK